LVVAQYSFAWYAFVYCWRYQVSACHAGLQLSVKNRIWELFMATDEAAPGMAAPVVVGATLLRKVTSGQPKDSYQPNDLPPVDDSLHTPEVIAALQKRAMQLD
jgi:hypothetical protein